MTIMRRIVVGADFSPSSVIAAEHAIGLARGSGAELVFVHVSDSRSSAEREAARIGLARLRDRAIALDITCSSRVAGGHPDAALSVMARSLEADLLCVGSHGRTGFERLLLGSVAERTTRRATCDVLVARGLDPWGGDVRVLVPTDFSSAADRALDLALRLARPANIHLFHCWKAPSSANGKLDDKADAIGREATRRAASLAAKHPIGRAELTFETCQGPAARTIREKLEEGGWDLVIMGCHGRRGVRRFLLGSVAEKTVRHAPCSVLVTHPSPES